MCMCPRAFTRRYTCGVVLLARRETIWKGSDWFRASVLVSAFALLNEDSGTWSQSRPTKCYQTIVLCIPVAPPPRVRESRGYGRPSLTDIQNAMFLRALRFFWLVARHAVASKQRDLRNLLSVYKGGSGGSAEEEVGRTDNVGYLWGSSTSDRLV